MIVAIVAAAVDRQVSNEMVRCVEAWSAIGNKPNISFQRVSRVFAEIEQTIAPNAVIIAPLGIMRTRSQKRLGAQI